MSVENIPMSVNSTEALQLIPTEEPRRCRQIYALRMHYEKYSDLYQNGIIGALTVSYFVSELMQNRFPEWLTSASYTMLQFSGLVGFNFQVSLLSKYCGDAHVARCGKDPLMFCGSVIKCAYVASGIGLTGLGTVAALFRQFKSLDVTNSRASGIGLAGIRTVAALFRQFELPDTAAALFRQIGRLGVTNSIYSFTRPWGLSLIGVGALMTIFNLNVNKHLLRQFDSGLDAEACHAIQQILRNDALNVDPEAYGLPQARLAIRIRCQMDKDTKRTASRVLDDASEEEVPEIVHRVAMKNIETQYKVTWAHLGLKIGGDILMGGADWWPGTVVDASCRLIASVAYIGTLVWQKGKQHNQRKAAHTIRLESQVETI